MANKQISHKQILSNIQSGKYQHFIMVLTSTNYQPFEAEIAYFGKDAYYVLTPEGQIHLYSTSIWEAKSLFD